MSELKLSNPVTAISEVDATGEIADIFADIRSTMELPLITSIWRILVDIPDGLPTTWRATKPIYQTGQPQAALLKMREQTSLPIPKPLTLSQLACVGISCTPANEPVPPSLPPWSQLRPLLPQSDISVDTWTLLQDIAGLLSPTDTKPREPTVATIWRHLAHWPGLLALAYTGLASLIGNGKLHSAMTQVNETAQIEGARIAHLRPEIATIPKDAYNLITRYASGVHRAVTIGCILTRWLRV